MTEIKGKKQNTDSTYIAHQSIRDRSEVSIHLITKVETKRPNSRRTKLNQFDNGNLASHYVDFSLPSKSHTQMQNQILKSIVSEILALTFVFLDYLWLI